MTLFKSLILLSIPLTLSLILPPPFNTIAQSNTPSKTPNLPPSPLSLNQAIQFALNSHSEYKKLLDTLKSKKLLIQKAEAEFYHPSIDLNPSFQLFSSTQYPKSLSPRWNFKTSLDINKVLFSFGQLSLQISISQKNYLIASLKTLQFKYSLIKNVKSTFLQCLATQQNLKTIQKSYEIHKINRDNQKKKYQQGQIPEFDYLRSQIQIQNDQIKIEKISHQLIKNINQLFQLIGFIPISEINPSSFSLNDSFPISTKNPPSIPPHSLFNQIQKRLDIQILKTQKQILLLNRDILHAKSKPVLSVFGQLAFQAGESPTPQPQDVDANLNYKIGVNFKIPLWELIIPSSKTKIHSKSLQFQISATQKSLNQLQKNAQTQITNHFIAFQESQKNIQRYQNIIQLTQKTFDIALKQYQLGTLDFLNYRDIELSFINSQLDFYLQIYHYNINYLNLLESMGLYSKLTHPY